MWSWGLVLWGVGFLGETHKWVVARIAEAWVLAGSAVGHVVAADPWVQILVAVVYIDIGIRFATFPRPVGAPAVVWYNRVFAALLWLPASAFVLGVGSAIMAYVTGAMVAFFAGVTGLVSLPFEAIVRGVLTLLGR